jgi:hypothetical protein
VCLTALINTKGDSIMANGDVNFTGMVNSASNNVYQAKLDEKVSQVMGNDDKISAKDLKKNSIFSKVYEALDETGKANFDKVLSLDGDANTVNEKEIRTLLTLLDADLTTEDGSKKFRMDNNLGTNKDSSGIYQATNDEINEVYNSVQTKAEREAAEIQKQKEASQEMEEEAKIREEVSQAVKNCDYKNGSDVAKTLNLINRYDKIIDDKEAIETLFKAKIVNTQTFRDFFGSKLYELSNRTTVYIDKSSFVLASGNECEVTIKRPNGTYEKYNAKGEFLSDEEPDEWYLFNDRTTKIYDENGNVDCEIDAYRYVTKQFYRNPDYSIDYYEEYEYDENGNNSRTVVRNADDSINCYYEYEYDEKGKCTKTVKKNADGSVIE